VRQALEKPVMEQLVRQLLELLGRVTGLESVYFTRIDWDTELQKVVWAHNTGGLDVPEGWEAPHVESVCYRALHGEPKYTTDVPGVYGDNALAMGIGLQTYLMVPVATPDGGVFGTMCGVSVDVVDVSDDARKVMETLSQMITLHLTAEATARRLAEANLRLQDLALLDPLTGIGNRRSLEIDLDRVCSQARRRGEPVGILSIDVDCFKTINDTHGHGAGDAVLCLIAAQLERQSRAGDIVARPGGDEFVVVLPGASQDVVELVGERIRRSVATTSLHFDGTLLMATVSVGGASGVAHDPAAMLAEADRALYLAKGRGRNCVAGLGGLVAV
jgi:diguanylate cyclase